MPDVSRRSFVEIATGMLASLPVLAGGRILAPRPAYAAEGDDATLASQLAGNKSEYVVIDVVEPWEVGCMVVDITKGTKKDGGLVSYPSVAGAKVKVTSRFNGKTVEGTTNENGVVNLDIRELTVREDGQDVNKLDSYYFNGTIQVECDGYRKFETALVVVEGGGGLQVPAHPLEDDKPYPYQVTFDEWDALYLANSFPITPANTDEHSVKVDVFGLPETGAATIELWVDGEKKPRASAKATVGESVQIGVKTESYLVLDYAEDMGVRLPIAMGSHWETKRTPVYGHPTTATFKARFLKKGDAACLPIGAKLHIAVTQGTTTYKWPLAVTTSEGIVDEPAGKEGQELSPINTQKGGTTSLDVVWPKSVPIIGGGDLKFWSPLLPINVYVNPFGLVQITLSLPLWGYRNDKGNDEEHGWQRYPHKSIEAQWDKKVKTMKAMADKTNSLVSKPGKIQQIDLFKSFSVDMNLQLLALAQWNADKGLFQGEVAGQFLAAINFTITENFFAGPIPVLITFALDASLIFALSAAAYSAKKNKDEKMIDAIFDFSRWSFDYVNTGFTMTFNLTPSLSVGVGIRGIVSISVKGSITLTLFFGVPMGTQPKGLPSPHFAAGWAARISLVLELFLFTKSFTLYDKAFENFYDNWQGKSLSAQAGDEALQALADKSIGELFSDLVPITDEMLAETAEASLSAQGLSAQGEQDYIDWGALADGGASQTLSDGTTISFRQEVVELADGSTMTMDVYELGRKVPEAREEGQAAAVATEEEQAAADSASAVTAPTLEPAEQAAATDGSSAVAGLAAGAVVGQVTGQAADAQAQATQPAGDGLEAQLTQPASESQTAQAAPATGQPSDAQAPEAALQSQEDQAAQAAQQGQATQPVQSATDGQPTQQDQPAQPATDNQQDQPAQETQPATDGQDALEAQESQTTPAEAEPVSDDTADATWLMAMASESLPSPAISSLGAQGGVRPSSDQLLFGSENQHVLSAAHAKVFDIGAPIGKTAEHGVWCFRVASVQVGGKPRTRVVANCIQGAPVGASRVIEIDTKLEGLPHDDLYDYNFDIMVRKELVAKNQTVSVVNLVILSGKRDNGGNTALASASTDLVISHTRIYSEAFVGNSTVLKGNDTGCFSMRASEIANREPSKFHSISCLEITNSPKEEWETTTDTTALLFLDRFSDAAEQVMDNQAAVCVGAVIVRRYLGAAGEGFQVNKYPASWWHDSVGDIDSTVYEADFTPTSPVQQMYGDVPYILMLRGAEKAHYFRTMLGVDGGDNYYFTPPESCGDFDPSVRLVWCPGVSAFLASYPHDPAQLDLAQDKRDYSQWSLHKISWVWPSRQAKVEPIGPSGFNVVNFAVRGNFLFWPQTRDAAEDRIWNNMHEDDVQAAAAIYQIMGCRVRGGRFSDPFVVADLPTDTDMLSVLSVNNAAVMEALRTEYVDTGERDAEGKPLYHAANIWYTSVPAVRCATATACEAPNPFVQPGGQIGFHVAVRNDGNTFLSGCTFELCALNAKTNLFERVPGASAKVTFGKDTIQESTYNRMGPDGKLTNLEDDYALAPGKTSVYAVTVTIPKDWPSGDKKVLFIASDGVVAKDYELSAQAEDEPEAVEFHVEPGDVPVVQQRTQQDQDSDQRHMEMVFVEEDVVGGRIWQEAPVKKEGVGSSGGGSVLPNTGDERGGSGLGLAGAGVAVLGAAVAAYERRRAENEGR